MISVLIELVNFAGLILLPMIPAYFLFKFLPGEAIVSRILKGWKINLTGGFAAYFALLLLLLPIFWPRPGQEVWKVKGEIKFETDGKPEPPLQSINISVIPPNQTIGSDGGFEMLIAVPRREGQREFPNITMDYEEYRSDPIILDKDQQKGWSVEEQPYKVNYLPWKRKIVLDGAVILKEK